MLSSPLIINQVALDVRHAEHGKNRMASGYPIYRRSSNRYLSPAAAQPSVNDGEYLDPLLAQLQRNLAQAMNEFLHSPVDLSIDQLPYFGNSVVTNIHRAVIERQAEARWANLGLDVQPYHERAQLSYLSAVCYPDTSQDRLTLCHDLILFAFLCDDRIDTTPSEEYSQIRRLHQECVSAIRRRPPAKLHEPLAHLLLSLGDRLLNDYRVDPAWYERFSMSVVDFLDHALLARIRWQKADPPPQPEAYLYDRYFDVAVSATLDMVEFAADHFVGEERVRAEELWSLRCLCSFNVALVNDIVSHKKESEVGNTNNMLSVLRLHRGFSERQARSCAIFLAQRAAREFEQRAARLPSDDVLVRGMRYWLQYSLDWHLRSGRYA